MITKSRGLLVAVALVLASACGDQEAEPRSQIPTVVVTTGIWADVVSNVACGGSVNVETLISGGADPHAFEPSLSDRATLDRASLIVMNGLLLEEGLEDTIVAAAATGVPVFRFGDHVDTIVHPGDHHEAGDADPHHGAGDADPHIWLDPTRVAEALPALVDALVAEIGLDAEALGTCMDDFRRELVGLDREIEGLVSAVDPQRRRLVTDHDSLGYFADRYGFEIVGTVSPASSGLAETSPARLEELARSMQATGLPAVFGAIGESSDDLEALAARVGGVQVVMLHVGALGSEDGPAGSYVDAMRSNVQLITEALR